MKFTFVFAYFFFADGGQLVAKDLFELLQDELVKTTDKLLEVIENILKRSELETPLKLEAINHTNLARTKRENLLNAVARDSLFESVVAD